MLRSLAKLLTACSHPKLQQAFPAAADHLRTYCTVILPSWNPWIWHCEHTLWRQQQPALCLHVQCRSEHSACQPSVSITHCLHQHSSTAIPWALAALVVFNDNATFDMFACILARALCTSWLHRSILPVVAVALHVTGCSSGHPPLSVCPIYAFSPDLK